MRALTLTVVSAIGSGLLMVLFGSLGDNLHGSERSVTQTALLILAVLVGGVCGLVIGRRDARARGASFGLFAGGVGGGLCGCAYAILMGLAFLRTYGGAPVGFLDAVAVGLAFPVFALLGAMAGGAIGAVLGACGAYLAAHLPPMASRRAL